MVNVQYLEIVAIGVEPTFIFGWVDATVFTPTVPVALVAVNVSITGV